MVSFIWQKGHPHSRTLAALLPHPLWFHSQKSGSTSTSLPLSPFSLVVPLCHSLLRSHYVQSYPLDRPLWERRPEVPLISLLQCQAWASWVKLRGRLRGGAAGLVCGLWPWLWSARMPPRERVLHRQQALIFAESLRNVCQHDLVTLQVSKLSPLTRSFQCS